MGLKPKMFAIACAARCLALPISSTTACQGTIFGEVATPLCAGGAVAKECDCGGALLSSGYCCAANYQPYPCEIVPCHEGAVAGECLCGENLVSTGYCCNGAPRTYVCDPPPCDLGEVLFACRCGDGVATSGFCCRNVAQAQACAFDIYYISSSDGDDDHHSGTSAAEPWKTLDKVDGLTPNPGDAILFRRGDTWKGTITPPASGAAGSPVMYGAYGAYGTGAKPVITGFTPVTSWTNKGDNIWESASPVSSLSRMNMVLIDGVNTPMGRTPNEGYFHYQSHSDDFHITSSDLTGDPDWTGAELAVNNNQWTTMRCSITAQSGDTLTFTQPYPFTFFQYDTRFIIQNDIRTLDRQNEWYYDPSTRKLSVYSVGEPSDASVSTVDELFVLVGKDYVTVQDLAFSGANARAIVINNADQVTISDCAIEYAGFDAVYGSYAGGYVSDGLVVENCTINHSNNGGIGVPKHFTNAIIRANTIANSGMIYGAGKVDKGTNQGGIAVGIGANGEGTVIERNRVLDTGYIGIAFHGNDTLVQQNFVHDFCLVNHDCGGVYTWNGWDFPTSGMSGMRVVNNIVDGGVDENCIYFDDYSNNIVVSGNSVSGCERGINLHNAYDMIVEDNTAFDNIRALNSYNNGYPEAPTTDVRLLDNLFVAKSADQLIMHFDSIDTTTPEITADDNVYAKPVDASEIIVGFVRPPEPWQVLRFDLAGWQEYSGQDEHSHASPVSVESVDDLFYAYNPSLTDKTIALDGVFVDMTGVTHSGSVIVGPYSSTVLVRVKDLPDSCRDDVMDGDETGVDCGGSCHPCGG
ncbi:MAG: hypothetical protein A2289_08725 [Deltaproteobacteria bacterium RIFOXYA12_FULL_58_15]|nr:MAG: hypothetical protein A2289_08725 [Deltaproteobacteria bacterium RIFOXYA12_FULL_58_15]OGR09337.1 MAG: hypothetical protein A2341_15870 [Deltaproteobacteria bacterium RIFOXYB12_FULL_58_9]